MSTESLPPNSERLRSASASSVSPDIAALIDVLERVSSQLPVALSKALFDNTLFQCRSEHKQDYLAEVQHNLSSLARMQPTDDRYAWLSERCQSQVMAIVQVSLRNEKRVKNSMRAGAEPRFSAVSTAQKASTQQHLAAELAKHHDYERRLTENLRLAQQQPDSAQAQQHILQCQQRLLRCQRAIAGIERKIDALQE